MRNKSHANATAMTRQEIYINYRAVELLTFLMTLIMGLILLIAY